LPCPLQASVMRYSLPAPDCHATARNDGVEMPGLARYRRHDGVEVDRSRAATGNDGIRWLVRFIRSMRFTEDSPDLS
jgi:cellulase/cellobiase CelA1